MDKLHLRSKLKLIIVTVVVVLLNLIYNFYNPSFEKVCNYATYEINHYASENAVNLKEYKGPILDLKQNDYYVFTWVNISEKDTNTIQVNISKKHVKEAFISGYNSNKKNMK
jgi:hypothetical protein